MRAISIRIKHSVIVEIIVWIRDIVLKLREIDDLRPRKASMSCGSNKCAS
jgi:hypothetical protein